MKILIFLLFVYTSVFSKDVKIGIYLYKSLYQKANIVKIIYILQEQLNSLSKTDYTFKITPYFNEEDILRDFYTYKLSLILIDSQLLLKNQKKLFAKSNDLWKMTFTKKEFEQYLIIKNKKSNATLKNIKDHNIYVYAKDSISTLWFRKRIYEIHKNSYKEFLKKEKALLKENKILYKVFFEKNSIGVINKERLETLSEINPQIKKV